MLHELGRIFLLSIHHKITKTLQVALFLSTGAENHRSNISYTHGSDRGDGGDGGYGGGVVAVEAGGCRQG